MILRHESNWHCERALGKRGDATARIICGWDYLIFAARWRCFVCCWSGVKRNWPSEVSGYYEQSESAWNVCDCSLRNAAHSAFWSVATLLRGMLAATCFVLVIR